MKNYFEFEDFNQNYSHFSVDPLTATIETVGKGFEMGGKIAESSARKRQSEAKIIEIAGKRQAQLKACETNKAFKKFLDPKYRKNRIKDCQDEVKKRLNQEEKEQLEIIKRMTSIEESKITSDFDKKKSEIEEKKSTKKNYIIGGFIYLVLILGTIIYIKSKKL